MKKNIFILSAVLTLLAAGCSFGIPGGNQPTLIPKPANTVTPVPTADPSLTGAAKDTPTPTDVTPTPAQDISATPAENPTEASPTPTLTPTPTPTPTPEPASPAECRAALVAAIGSGYVISEATELKIDADVYYRFTVSTETVVFKPDVVVNSNGLKIYYYYENTGERLALESFPLDNGEPIAPVGDPLDGITPAEAQSILQTISGSRLGLANDISSYTIQVDNYITQVQGEECYGVDVLNASGMRVGAYFISADRSSVYRVDDEGFIELIK